MEAQEPAKIKAMNKSQLARMYKVCTRTLNKWLAPFAHEIGEIPNTNTFTPEQVRIIFEKIGEP
jgi:hypothetical protein